MKVFLFLGLLLLLLMVYECIGCHHRYDRKGSLTRHQARCTRFKQEALKRRAKYSQLAATQADNAPTAGLSNEAEVVLEDVMDFDQEEVGLELSPDRQDDVIMLVSLTSTCIISILKFLY